jgi:hypothetical protein
MKRPKEVYRLEKKRIWNLHLNLDTFNAMSVLLFSDESRSLAYQGLSLGMNGGQCPATAPEAFIAGFNFGQAMLTDAVERQEKKVQAGESSAAVRRVKYGTAQPSVEHCSNTARTPLEQTTEHDSEQTPNLSKIQDPVSKSEHPKNENPKAEREDEADASSPATIFSSNARWSSSFSSSCFKRSRSRSVI